jgi:class 3 adenylate cyclase
MEPQIQFAKTSDGVSIAFWSVGADIPLVDIHPFGFSNIQLDWQADPAAFHHRLAETHRLIRFDPRGTGLSERHVEDLSPVRLLADLEAVVDHLSLDRFAIFAELAGAHVAIDYAVAHPGRVSALLLHDGYARAQDFWRIPRVRSLHQLIDDWEMFSESLASAVFGWDAGAPAREFAAYIRASTSPEAMRLYLEQNSATDVTGKLAAISVPTLLLQEREAVFPPFEMARTLAALIPGCQLRVIESGTPWSPEVSEAILAAVTDFVREVAGTPEHAPIAATRSGASTRNATAVSGTAVILFTDIVSSTELTERMGDSRFRDASRALDASLRAAIRDAGGAAIDGKLLGDGVLATFPSAAQAIDGARRCLALSAASELGLHIGLHAGDVIREDNNVYGGAVNIASRICGLSAPGEILVSDVVRGMARSSAGVEFEDRGEQEMKGVGEPVRVYAVRGA